MSVALRLLLRWWWVAVALLFFACVALKLNGSSVGRWQKVLREPEPVRGLLFSTPKKIRSDEWVVWTPSILSQARQTPPFPIENSSLGYGRAPLLMSLPVAYYTTFFRPQLWGFFLFDLERGFSWYWCTKVFGLLLASAWLLHQGFGETRSFTISRPLRVLPRKLFSSIAGAPLRMPTDR